MTKLNEIVAVANGAKSAAESALKNAYHSVQKEELFNGIRRNYQTLDESGEVLPSESKIVQMTAGQVIRELSNVWTQMVDVVATQETGNAVAKAPVIVDGKTILEDVPVTVLIFLEKKLTDLHTLVGKIPVLCTGETWSKDVSTDLWQSTEAITHRTKKLQKPIVLYDATPEHPAQTQLVTEDVLVGHWHTTKLSGATPAVARTNALNKINKLKNAVICAREQANSAEVENVQMGNAIFAYLFE